MQLLFYFLCIVGLATASPSGHASKDLNVYINVTYSPPASFHQSPPFYQAGSTITLTCIVDGVTEGVFFEWNSNCKGATCFGLGSSSQSISKKYLESKDSGTHTCIVYDVLGCSGNASIVIKVVGAGIYVTQGDQSLPDDSLIVAHPLTNLISEFRCLSGTTEYNIGQFIGVHGEDIVSDTNDPFYISRGTRFSPGIIHVRSSSALEAEYEGIYTCQMPDETGTTTSVNVGLYQSGVKAPNVTGIDIRVKDFLHVLLCNSSGSPATTVLWTFNDEPISVFHNDSQYPSESKVIIDRKASIYSSMLMFNGSIEEIVGQYSCQVRNRLGTSNKVVKEVKGLYLSGNEKPIIVGLSRVLNCSTHLNVSLMEWILVGIQDDPVEQTSTSQFLPLTLSPKTVGLDGAMFTCRAKTVRGKVFEETMTVRVKENSNTISIPGEASPILAGSRYTLECTVTSDITPTVRWMDRERNNVTSSDDFLIEGPISSGLITVLRLTFLSLKTYHGGVYYCQSIVDNPPSVQEESQEIIVRFPPPRVNVTRSPSDNLLYTTTQLNITCLVEVVGVSNTTAVVVNKKWSGPGTHVLNNSVDISEGHFYESSITISSLQSSDSGAYICSFVVSSSSPYIEASDKVSASMTIRAALKVSVTVSYTAPDQYPQYSPHLFRAASSVTLRCIVEGASGSVQYQWSSTCNSCFASNSYSSTISERFLRSKDSGKHTCTATDAAGNVGSYIQPMNITGAGIYVETATSYGGRESSQPNNTYITYRSPSSESDYFALYCCSGSKNSYVGTITDPNGYTRSSSYDNIYEIERYSRSSSHAGCIRFKARKICRRYSSSYYYRQSCQYYYDDPTTGTYTCNIQDKNGAIQHVGFTLLSGSTYPVISSFSRVRNTNTFTLICVTYQAPPTTIKWTRNGRALDINNTTIRLIQTITNRRSVYYENKIEIFDHLDNVTGSYRCTVDNNHYYSARSQYLSISGIQVTLPSSRLRVGQSATFQCSSDLDPTNITWYREDGTVMKSTSYSSNQMTLSPVSTDNEGQVFKCKTVSLYGSQERNITLTTYVPENWATVQITGYEENRALHGNNYTLTCTVTLVPGTNLPITTDWEYNNHSITPRNHLVVNKENTSLLITTLRLTFTPIDTTNGGDYTCRASINVPWMDRQPAVISDSVHIPVTTQAIFQLKLGPVQYCVNWHDNQASQLEEDIKVSIETAIQKECNCDFEHSAIYSGEFSCQTTTTNVIYRAIINGTSDILTAPQLLELIENWRVTGGTLLYNNKFRLRVAQKEACPLKIESFHDPECSIDNNNASSLALPEFVQMDRYYKITT